MKEIVKGSIVKYQGNNYMVKTLFKNGTATLSVIFRPEYIYHRKVNVTDLVEDYEAWYQGWTESETYQLLTLRCNGQ